MRQSRLQRSLARLPEKSSNPTFPPNFWLPRSIKAVDGAYGTVTGARNLSRALSFCKSDRDSVRQAMADFPLVLRARIKA